MTDNNRIQHNARLIRAKVRGMSKNERARLYEVLRMGPLLGQVVVILGAFMQNARHQQNEEKLAAGDLG